MDEFNVWMAIYEGEKGALEADVNSGKNIWLDVLSRALERIFQKFCDDFDKYEVLGKWEEWIHAHAYLFWKYKGAPRNQPQEGMVDDWMQAKRYLGYLVAQHLLSRFEEPKQADLCPREMLSAGRAKYLLSLNLEEFARMRAYFMYRSRRSGNSPSIHDRDYTSSTKTIYQALDDVVGWPRRDMARCRDCRPRLASVHLKGDENHSTRKQVEAARKRDLARLGLDSGVAKLADECLDSLAWLFTEVGNGDLHRLSQEPARLLKSHLAVANMFDFFVACLLTHKDKGEITTERRGGTLPSPASA